VARTSATLTRSASEEPHIRRAVRIDSSALLVGTGSGLSRIVYPGSARPNEQWHEPHTRRAVRIDSSALLVGTGSGLARIIYPGSARPNEQSHERQPH
jgi:hypothetical protein